MRRWLPPSDWRDGSARWPCQTATRPPDCPSYEAAERGQALPRHPTRLCDTTAATQRRRRLLLYVVPGKRSGDV